MIEDPTLPSGNARQTPRGKLPVLGLSALGIVFGDIGTSPLYTFTVSYTHLTLPTILRV